MRFRPLALVLVAPLVALAGASGGGTTPRLSDAPMQLGDLPHGWKATPVAGAGDRFDRELAACLHVPVTAFSGAKGDRSVTSPTFSTSESLTVAHRVTVRASEDAARKELDRFTGGDAKACVGKVLGDGLVARLKGAEAVGAKLGERTVSVATVPAVADERYAIEVVQPVTILNAVITTRERLIVLRKGRGVGMLVIQANGVAIPSYLGDDLVKSVAERLPPK
jgi:hypothetical protein